MGSVFGNRGWQRSFEVSIVQVPVRKCVPSLTCAKYSWEQSSHWREDNVPGHWSKASLHSCAWQTLVGLFCWQSVYTAILWVNRLKTVQRQELLLKFNGLNGNQGPCWLFLSQWNKWLLNIFTWKQVPLIIKQVFCFGWWPVVACSGALMDTKWPESWQEFRLKVRPRHCYLQQDILRSPWYFGN